MKPSLQTIFSIGCFVMLACNPNSKSVGDRDWPLDKRQNLSIRQPPTCDTFLYKTLHFELSHERTIDTSQFALVIEANWPLYSGDYKEELVIDSIPYCQSDMRPQSLKCYLVNKQTPLSYQFQAKYAFNLLDSSVRSIKLKLYSSDIEHSGSNMKISLNNGNWIY